jgi:L-fucose dehydrogenase
MAPIPLGQRVAKAEEVVATMVFLVSERASHRIGQWLFADGGHVYPDRACAG